MAHRSPFHRASRGKHHPQDHDANSDREIYAGPGSHVAEAALNEAEDNGEFCSGGPAKPKRKKKYAGGGALPAGRSKPRADRKPTRAISATERPFSSAHIADLRGVRR